MKSYLFLIGLCLLGVSLGQDIDVLWTYTFDFEVVSVGDTHPPWGEDVIVVPNSGDIYLNLYSEENDYFYPVFYHLDAEDGEIETIEIWDEESDVFVIYDETRDQFVFVAQVSETDVMLASFNRTTWDVTWELNVDQYGFPAQAIPFIVGFDDDMGSVTAISSVDGSTQLWKGKVDISNNEWSTYSIPAAVTLDIEEYTYITIQNDTLTAAMFCFDTFDGELVWMQKVELNDSYPSLVMEVVDDYTFSLFQFWTDEDDLQHTYFSVIDADGDTNFGVSECWNAIFSQDVDIVYCTMSDEDGSITLYAFDVLTGEQVWNAEVGSMNFLLTNDEDSIYSYTSDTISSYSADEGTYQTSWDMYDLVLQPDTVLYNDPLDETIFYAVNSTYMLTQDIYYIYSVSLMILNSN